LPATKQEVLDTIKNVNEKTGLKTLVVSHLPEVHSYMAHRVLWLEGGRIVEEGEPEYVFEEIYQENETRYSHAPEKSDKTMIK